MVTLGVIAFVARAALAGPPPGWLLVAVCVGYLLFLNVGVVFMRLGMFVDVINTGPRGARGVALTFDDGPDPEHTPRILDMLDEGNAKAVFFVIARKAEQYPEVVKQIAARGHTVGVHSYGHDRLLSLRLTSTIRADLGRCIEIIESITGTRPTLFRPPVGPISYNMSRSFASWALRRRVVAPRPRRVVRRHGRVGGAPRDPGSTWTAWWCCSTTTRSVTISCLFRSRCCRRSSRLWCTNASRSRPSSAGWKPGSALRPKLQE